MKLAWARTHSRLRSICLADDERGWRQGGRAPAFKPGRATTRHGGWGPPLASERRRQRDGGTGMARGAGGKTAGSEGSGGGLGSSSRNSAWGGRHPARGLERRSESPFGARDPPPPHGSPAAPLVGVHLDPAAFPMLSRRRSTHESRSAIDGKTPVHLSVRQAVTFEHQRQGGSNEM
ncbi:unnamed protein product [Lampetra planeri]